MSPESRNPVKSSGVARVLNSSTNSRLLVTKPSALVFIVPGVLILVPGSAGFNSLLKLLTGQTVSGIDAGFNTFVTAMAIAYGLMLSTVVLPRRFTSIGPRGAAHA